MRAENSQDEGEPESSGVAVPSPERGFSTRWCNRGRERSGHPETLLRAGQRVGGLLASQSGWQFVFRARVRVCVRASSRGCVCTHTCTATVQLNHR